MIPIRLPRNCPPDRFYRGGASLAAFRDAGTFAEHEPEDWVGSTTTIRGEDVLGLSTLPDGRLLRDAVSADPVGWLGQDHAARWGDDTQLLVKVLDAGQRLPVHAHPDDAFAGQHLGRAHGKAEAWYILTGGTVHVGLREDVDIARLTELTETQDVAALLGLLHEVTVAPGDVVWVPAGELHAIGAGVLLLELQQPEDLSILLEWDGFELDGVADGHLDLGFPVALQAVNTRARTSDDLRELISTAPSEGSVLPSAADAFFRLERIRIEGEGAVDAGFSILVVVDGAVDIDGSALGTGEVLLVPASAGRLEVRGDGELLVARPPAP